MTLNLTNIRAVLLAFGGFFVVSATGLAQETEAAEENVSATEEEAPLILERQNVVGGPASWLRGLEAYQAGDFKLAELEFRSVNNFFSEGVLASRFGGTDSADIFFRIGGFEISGTGANERNRNRQGISSIEDSYAQSSYALGATLVKLGELEEARKMFGKAVFYDKEIHDARVRMSLIDLLLDKTGTAEEQIGILTNWCQSIECDDQSEVGKSLITIRSALNMYVQGKQTAEPQN